MFRLKYASEDLKVKAYETNRGVCFYCKKNCDVDKFWMISEKDLVIIDESNIHAIAICHPECHENDQIEKIRQRKKLLFDITAYPVFLYFLGSMIILVSLILFWTTEHLHVIPLMIGVIIAMTGRRIWLDNYIANKKKHEELKDVDQFYHEKDKK